jgi:DnaJ-class molecular chaperone
MMEALREAMERVRTATTTCPECHGAGWYWGADDWPHFCEACNGNGKIARE